MPRWGEPWSEGEVNAYVREIERKFKSQDRAAVQTADMEPDPRDAAQAAHAGKKVDQKFRIGIHSRRRRLCDPDGLYSKAAIDGLTEGAILVDDNPEVVTAVSYSQERCEVEETVIEIWEVLT